MRQERINSVSAALDAATKAIGGASTNGPTIGLKHCTAEVITTERNALVIADGLLDIEKTELATRTATAATALRNATAFLTLARDMLKPTLGTQYSTAWDALGYVGSIMVPRNFEGVKFRLQKLHAYITAHPEAQSLERNITPLHVQSMLDNLVNDENAVLAQRTLVGKAVKARQNAFTTVVKRISALARELALLVQPTDQVYLSFGLNFPAAKAIPSVPENLNVELISETSAALSWEPSEGAERYRVYQQVIGTDNGPVLVATREELDIIVQDLPLDAVVQFSVAAINESGESGKSACFAIRTRGEKKLPRLEAQA